MKALSIAAVFVAAAAISVSAAHELSAGDPSQDKTVTVTGCAVRGDSHGDGFLLVNNVERTTVTTVSPTPTGGVTVGAIGATAMMPSRILYWLDDDDDVVEPLMGQLVEITGEPEGDIKEGDIKVERENDMIELEIDADGRKANVKLPAVPSAVGAPGSVKDDERKLDYLVRKLDVKSARSIAPTCK